jgi:hypothetical protein
MQLQAAGLWPAQPTGPYIEEVFSTYLYTGNAGTQTVTNGIDLSTKGGMVWTKSRSNAYAHSIMDTVRGFNYSGTQTRRLDPSTTGSEADEAGNATQATPLSNGFSITTSGGGAINFYNASGATYASWTFREQPKFFDVVTYTGNGSNRTIAHNLGSEPGCMIVKRTDSAGQWRVYHVDLGPQYFLLLNATDAANLQSTIWNNTAPTSTVFSVGTSSDVNGSGNTYVAYLFAHNAGGFGLTGTDNVISCGSFTTNSSAQASVTLGYEPQWLLIKRTDSTGNWQMMDVMRGNGTADGNVSNQVQLFSNLSNAESSATYGYGQPTATGFYCSGQTANNATYIYIAIRRGPMRVPTVGTTVFAPVTYTGDNSNTRVISTGFPPDMVWTGPLDPGGRRAGDRLRGLFTNPGPVNYTYATGEETFNSYSLPQMSGWQTGNGTVRFENSTAVNYVLHAFKRAPSFFDVVCYTGTGVARTVTHNLAAVPELMIVKQRSSAGEDWLTYSSATGNTKYLYINGTASAQVDSRMWNDTTPTSSVFTVGTYGGVNSSGVTLVAYLFATCAGVSKVGSYTGTGTTLQIDCGFTAGSRFVLIKRTDSTGDWYVWDSARGIVAGNDPYLLLNSAAAEVTGTDYVDTYNAGFEISSTAPAAINANGGTFIFLAIA